LQYWDTSALVKLFVFESDSDWFGNIAKTNPVILSSTFARVELSCALLRKEADRGIPSGAAATFRQRFREDCGKERFRLIPYNQDVIQEAERIAETAYGQAKPILIRSLDLIHVASASVVGATVLLTTDARMRELATLLGMDVQPR
jgi:predicted nucleic acid-binding protein